jgi:hypothetical protein
VTLQSFLWSKRLKEQGTEQQEAEAAARGEAAMAAEPSISVDSIFTFRQGVFLMQCSGSILESNTVPDHPPATFTRLFEPV